HGVAAGGGVGLLATQLRVHAALQAQARVVRRQQPRHGVGRPALPHGAGHAQTRAHRAGTQAIHSLAGIHKVDCDL
ncbi:unnamed protein product, partial [Closterium sp. NIES-53]